MVENVILLIEDCNSFHLPKTKEKECFKVKFSGSNNLHLRYEKIKIPNADNINVM